MRQNLSYTEINFSLRVVDYTVNMILPFLPLVALSNVIHWPLTRIANYSGDIVLGAIFPVHERSPVYECGRIQEEGIQQLESLLFTLKKINADSSILPGIKLGILALDSCDSTAYALEQTMDFIKGFIARNNEYLAERQYSCIDGSLPKFRDGMFDRIAGIIGGQSSAVSIQLANLLRLFKVPQISYLSTSPTLSNKHKYDYFFRTVPSDVNQVQAILAVLKEFRWTYVSVVYSDTDYGNKGYEQLLEVGKYFNICFSSPQSINVDHFTDKDYENVIRNLMHKINAKVVVVFSDKQTARNIMSAAKRLNAINRFIWIGSDAWCCRDSVVSDLESVVEGAITVSPLVRQLEGFSEYFTNLTPKNNLVNPWFAEYWEEHFRCKLPDSTNTPFNDKYRHWCPDTKQISVSSGFRQTPTLHFVRDAAYAFAYALHDMHKEKCNGIAGLCPAMRNVDGFQLKKYIEKVNFRDESGKTFRFLPSGDAPPRYSIINFQKLSNNSYVWKPVGTYMLRDDGEASLDLNRNAMRFKSNEHAFPRSYCSEPCKAGQAKLQLEGDTCCWLCTNCSQYQYLPDSYHCEDCRLGTLPNWNKTLCESIPEAYLSYSDPWAIGTMTFAGLGIIVTCFVALVFRVFGNTPIIKAAGRELSYLLLSGILLSFLMTFIIISKPTAFTCGLTKFFLGFCYALNYSAIVTKTNRIARIFKRSRAPKKLKYTSPQSQLVITGFLVSIEALINIVWLVFERPKVEHVYPTREENVLICHGSDNTSYLIGLIYPSILIAFCTAFAFKTRKCPEGFNEARYLTFTNYTTCVIWLAFLPLFVLSTSTAIRVVTLSLLLSLSGSVQLCCLFIPKVYIAVLKPEKNTKENVMCSHHFNRNQKKAANLAQSPSPTRIAFAPPSILVNGGSLLSSFNNSFLFFY
ncbi:metabotropic glutamate receptor 3-like protein [Leptotrombidium deliense]|uniref:Metabotropic glutamate receptor 3-like protein n=1 Tax=Leptotrombidium deliense TaxID=299467 RepID=A0A443SWZ3_9ACAR|nr:metabotropic glutamate receptor 3-like protein [Leptotrombidium deliense]